MIADRMRRVEPSRLLELIVEGQRMRKEGADFIDLGPGQPDFSVPEPILEATARALREGHTYYSPPMGISELREAVAQRYNRRYGAKYGHANAMVTAGAKGALYHIIGSHMDEGGEVIIPAPYYVSTPEIVKLWGGTPKFLPCRMEQGFQPDPEELRAMISPATRGIVLNSPCNPTGAVLSRSLLSSILEIADQNRLFVIMDECYDRYLYPGVEYATMPHFDPEARRPFFIAGSFSKTFSMTGYRMGYAIGPAEGIAAAGKIQSHSMNGPTTFAQFGALEALRREEELFAPVLEQFTRRRQAICDGLARIPGMPFCPPQGAFYVFPDARGLMRKMGIERTDALASALLKEAGVMVIPGSALGQEGFVRISFAVEEEKIREAVERIRKAVGA
jgi:aspartate aminotransferase